MLNKMKIHVGIVEDNPIAVEQLRKQLDKWKNEYTCEIVYYVETSGEDFLLHIPKELDIVFIDIQLHKLNGIQLAHELRNKNYDFEIVFLTAFSEYVFQGYEVRALNYLLKPISYEDVKKCMDFILEQLATKHYVFLKNQSIYKIPYNDILYLTSYRHYVEIKTTKTNYRELTTLKNFLSQLPPQFMQCHRTTIVNIQHVLSINGTLLTMSDNVVNPVSKTYLTCIRNGILKSVL